MYSVEEALGGKKHLGVKRVEFDVLIRKGIPIAAGNELKHKLSLTDKEFASAVGLSQRTFSRMKVAGAKLSPDASDRLHRLARVFSFAVEVLGSEESAKEWLNRRNIALGNRVPMDMIKTDAGAEEVNEMLLSIRYGGAV